MKVVLVGIDGVHIEEFDVQAEEPPKLVSLPTQLNWNARLFVHRTGNYYDEVKPLAARDPNKPRPV